MDHVIYLNIIMDIFIREIYICEIYMLMHTFYALYYEPWLTMYPFALNFVFLSVAFFGIS